MSVIWSDRFVPSVFLAPPDDPDVVYEFFAPFAHVPGRFEWCRIRSPTHGVFDCFIVLGASTAVPATVYVDSDHGASFMRDRYPECTCIRTDEQGLHLEESPYGRVVRGRMVAAEGPIRRAQMEFRAGPGLPKQAAYGGEGEPVWGSERFTCWGVDLNLDAKVHGTVETSEGSVTFQGDHGIIASGSFGRIAPWPVG